MKWRIGFYVVVAVAILAFFAFDFHDQRKAPRSRRSLAPRKNTDAWLAREAAASSRARQWLRLQLPCDLTMSGWRSIGSLSELGALRISPTIEGRYSKIPNAAGLRSLKELRRLYELDLWFVTFQGVEFEQIALWPRLRRLRVQYPSGLVQSDFQEIGSMQSLNWLTLRGTTIDQDRLIALAGLTACRGLSLPECRLTDEHLEALAPMKSIEDLGLRRNGIRGTGLRHLDGLDKLAYLSVRANPIGDREFIHLSPRSSMRGLSLVHTHLTDASMEHIVKFVELTSLGLPSSVRGPGLKKLASLSSLTRLVVSGATDPDAVAQLQRALPELEIKVSD